MLPEILDLGFAKINGYGTMIAIGVLLAWWAVGAESRRKGLKVLADDLHTLIPLIALMAFVGGKLLYIVLYEKDFQADLDRHGFIGSLGQGFVFYGSLLAAIPVALWRFRKLGVPARRAVDALFVGAPIVHGFGRLGCFCAGCCYGCTTDGPLAVTFTRGMGLVGVPLHPVQVYEALGEAVIFLVLWFLVRKRIRFDGQVALTYLALYAMLRFGTEALRGDGNPVVLFGSGHEHVRGAAPDGITTGQLTSFLLFVPCVALIAAGLRRHPRRPDARA